MTLQSKSRTEFLGRRRKRAFQQQSAAAPAVVREAAQRLRSLTLGALLAFRDPRGSRDDRES